MTIARLIAVMDQHPPERAPGIARALAVLMLLAGIVAMHSAVFGTAHAGGNAHGHEAPGATTAPSEQPEPTATDGAVLAATSSDHAHQSSPAADEAPIAAPSDPHTGCGAAGCDEHVGVHGCVFVLSAIALASTLVLLYRLGDTAEIARRTSKVWRARSERPPPWTVLTLSQLAILRI